MMQPSQIDDLVCLITSLDRSALLDQFQSYPARFPVDFTDDFLQSTSLDRLRHIFFALCIQNDRMPNLPQAA